MPGRGAVPRRVSFVSCAPGCRDHHRASRHTLNGQAAHGSSVGRARRAAGRRGGKNRHAVDRIDPYPQNVGGGGEVTSARGSHDFFIARPKNSAAAARGGRSTGVGRVQRAVCGCAATNLGGPAGATMRALSSLPAFAYR